MDLTMEQSNGAVRRWIAWILAMVPLTLALVFAGLDYRAGVPARTLLILFGFAAVIGAGYYVSFQWFGRHFPERPWISHVVGLIWIVFFTMALLWLLPLLRS